MARALESILTELNAVYDPQRGAYNEQITALDPQQKAEEQGLEFAKRDAFDQITNQANRRGLFYSGIPVAEEQRYTGAQFLPAVANLKGRYAQQRFNLRDALLDLTRKQYESAYGIRQNELDTEAAERARAAGSGNGFIPTNSTNNNDGNDTPTPNAPQKTLRQQWQEEANAGDWEAQTLLNFVGDNNWYDGHVNSQAEYDILKKYGVGGNYYVANQGGAQPTMYDRPKPAFPTTR